MTSTVPTFAPTGAPLFTSDQVRTIESANTQIDLMRRAGKAAAEFLLTRTTPESCVVLFAGPGNNGGDALACAAELAVAGYAPMVILLGDPERFGEDAAHAWRRVVELQDFQSASGSAPSPLVGEGRGEGEGNLESNLSPANRQSPHPSPVLQTASAQACADRSGGGSHAIRNPASTPQGKRGQTVALSMQEDFVILKQDNDTLRTEYLSVCFPSRWDPREKLGLDFAAIHAPVADNQMLQAAGPNIITMAFMKQPMLRHVWLIVPAASLDQHPDKNQAWWHEALNDPSPLLPRLCFRIERQTTWPLPHLQRAVFFIRLMMSPLVDVLSVRPERSEGSDGMATRAAQLAASLRSMTPAIVAYRGLTDALPRLLNELDAMNV